MQGISRQAKKWLLGYYRVARGFEETWGRERNSSRSMVPELSCIHNEPRPSSSGRPSQSSLVNYTISVSLCRLDEYQAASETCRRGWKGLLTFHKSFA